MADAATEAKEKGNSAYKARDFATAHVHYDKAIELDAGNIIYYNNKAAVLFEEAKYRPCIELCEKAVEVGRENRAEFKQIAKSLARAGNAYERLGELPMALKFFQKSLAEFRDPNIVKKSVAIEKQVKEQERLAYIDPEKALAAKELGNKAFTTGQYPDAIKHYTEAIKRNPDDPKVYSNRAASYNKLCEYGLAVRDCDECLRLDPTFVKGYLRKAGAHLALKETSKAKDCYQKALELDPNCHEAQEGLRSSFRQAPTDADKQQAMNDPEVQSILADPSMRLILQQMQENPTALSEHLKNPEIKAKLEKLLESGILQVR